MNMNRRDVIKLAAISLPVSALRAFAQQTSFTFRSALAFIPYLEDEYFIAVLDFPGFWLLGQASG